MSKSTISTFELFKMFHGSGEYVRDGVHTNSIESVWAVIAALLMTMAAILERKDNDR